MQKLPEITTVPTHHLDRLPYEVWGHEAVQAADHGVADMLNAEAFQQHHEYMQGATASDEAGWYEHLTPLLDVYGEHMTPEKVHSEYGSYALLAAEAAEVTAQAYEEAGKGAQEAPKEVKRHLDHVRTALRDIPQDDHPDPKIREGGQKKAALVDQVLNSHDDIPWTFRAVAYF